MAAVVGSPGSTPPPSPPADGHARSRRPPVARTVILVIAGVYFLVPLAGAIWFAIYNSATGFSVHAFTGMFDQPHFTSAFLLSVRLSVLTVVATLVIMLPTALLVHLRLPRWRRALEVACLLPLVIPPVVLVVGVSTVLGWGPDQLAGTPLQGLLNWVQNSWFPLLGSTPVILVGVYVVLALPFTYRALDAGLRTSSVGVLVEAARSLGASWPRVLLSVIVPALRTSILNAAFLGFALAFGEFTVASILNYLTFTPWIYQFNNQDGQLAVGVALMSLLITWGFLLVITALGRSRKSS